MMTQSLLRFTRAAVAAGVLALTAGAASADAVTSAIPLPFPAGSGVTLKPAAPTMVPGFGVADAFYISDFKFGSYDADGTDALLKLTATFSVGFKDEAGKPTGSAALPGDFVLRIKGAPAKFDPLTSPLLGAFDSVVDLATFKGKTSDGKDMVVQLAEPPVGKVEVKANIGLGKTGFLFDTPTPFLVTGQYSVDGGEFVNVPGLTAINMPVGFKPAI